MPKSSYEKALEKQIKESKSQAREANRQAEAAARRERAKTIIDGQPIKNGLRILDGNAEQLLKIILDTYDGGETNCVQGNMENITENLQRSFNLELEKLIMYGVISNSYTYIGGGWEVYLSQQGKTYFADKASAENSSQGSTEKYMVRKKYDVFISHANKDKLAYVDSLYNALQNLGIKIFYDIKELTWGDNWKQVILDGVEKSEFAIVVISKEFFGREWTERELNEFLQRQNENGQKIILPLLYNLSFNELKEHYPELEFIQSIKSNDKSLEEITIELAKQLIKRYREQK